MPEFIDIRVDGAVATIALNRPDKANAMHRPLWNELRDAMRWLDETPTIRVGVLTGAGRHFTAGIDLSLLDELRQGVESGCAGRSREKLRRDVERSDAGVGRSGRSHHRSDRAADTAIPRLTPATDRTGAASYRHAPRSADAAIRG